MIAPFNVIPPLSELPIVNTPISVPLPITPTDVVPVPASSVTVSWLAPSISPIVMFPPSAPVSTVRFDPFASSIFPVAKVILSFDVKNCVAAPAARSIVSPLFAVIVVAPLKL